MTDTTLHPPQVMQRGLIAGASLSAIYTLIVPQLALSPSASDLRPLSPLWHVCQEGITCTAVLFVLWSSLAKHKPWEQGLLTAKWDSNLILQTVLICCLSFPICDLLVYEPWSRLVTVRNGFSKPYQRQYASAAAMSMNCYDATSLSVLSSYT